MRPSSDAITPPLNSRLERKSSMPRTGSFSAYQRNICVKPSIGLAGGVYDSLCAALPRRCRVLLTSVNQGSEWSGMKAPPLAERSGASASHSMTNTSERRHRSRELKTTVSPSTRLSLEMAWRKTGLLVFDRLLRPQALLQKDAAHPGSAAEDEHCE